MIKNYFEPSIKEGVCVFPYHSRDKRRNPNDRKTTNKRVSYDSTKNGEKSGAAIDYIVHFSCFDALHVEFIYQINNQVACPPSRRNRQASHGCWNYQIKTFKIIYLTYLNIYQTLAIMSKVITDCYAATYYHQVWCKPGHHSPSWALPIAIVSMLELPNTLTTPPPPHVFYNITYKC